jgi:hypothetical protein
MVAIVTNAAQAIVSIGITKSCGECTTDISAAKNVKQRHINEGIGGKRLQ